MNRNQFFVDVNKAVEMGMSMSQVKDMVAKEVESHYRQATLKKAEVEYTAVKARVANDTYTSSDLVFLQKRLNEKTKLKAAETVVNQEKEVAAATTAPKYRPVSKDVKAATSIGASKAVKDPTVMTEEEISEIIAAIIGASALGAINGINSSSKEGSIPFNGKMNSFYTF